MGECQFTRVACQAVCCKDGNHCCPSRHTCEPHHSSCSRGSHVIPWFAKVSAVTEPGAVIDVKCDNKSSCASGTTCCKLKTGKWGCCPLVKVCASVMFRLLLNRVFPQRCSFDKITNLPVIFLQCLADVEYHLVSQHD